MNWILTYAIVPPDEVAKSNKCLDQFLKITLTVFRKSVSVLGDLVNVVLHPSEFPFNGLLDVLWKERSSLPRRKKGISDQRRNAFASAPAVFFNLKVFLFVEEDARLKEFTSSFFRRWFVGLRDFVWGMRRGW